MTYLDAEVLAGWAQDRRQREIDFARRRELGDIGVLQLNAVMNGLAQLERIAGPTAGAREVRFIAAAVRENLQAWMRTTTSQLALAALPEAGAPGATGEVVSLDNRR